MIFKNLSSKYIPFVKERKLKCIGCVFFPSMSLPKIMKPVNVINDVYTFLDYHNYMEKRLLNSIGALLKPIVIKLSMAFKKWFCFYLLYVKKI